MNLESKDIIDAIQRAGKVDTVEKLLWDIKGSIKQDLQAIASQTKQDIVQANQLQVAELKAFMLEAISDNNDTNLKPLRIDIEGLKSDRKALRYVAATISSAVAFIGTVAGYIISGK